MVQAGAEGIILGCTEIELLVHEEDGPVPLFPTTKIHIIASEEYMRLRKALMPAETEYTFRTWGRSWLALTAGFALHVADEAANDFLAVYNPTVRAIRDRFPVLPLPTFTFPEWLSGLVLGVVILASLSPLVFRGTRQLKYVAYPYAVVMFLNGVQHIGASLYMGKFMPGVLSAPVLLITSTWLFVATKRACAMKKGSLVVGLIRSQRKQSSR